MRHTQDCITGKRRYQTRDEAQIMADKIGNMYTYKCPHCKGAHLTKQSPESRAARGIPTPSQKRRETRKRAKRRELVARVVVLGEDNDDGWWKKDKRLRSRKDPGKNKDDEGCKHCTFGPWGLLNNRREIRFCTRKNCNSSEERPHSCAKNGCWLHPDNQ